jgi:dolichyl-phosphate beta-glucosyltransferase
MSKPEVHLSVVIPVYNGAGQLPATFRDLAEFLGQRDQPVEVILVDDHSGEPAATMLRHFTREHPAVRLISNEGAQGKGSAVARGMLAARGRYRVFTDADLAYPIGEVDRMVKELEAGAQVAVACRVLPESRYLMSPSYFNYLYTRHVMSRVFNLLVRWFVIPGILDTQAGLKGFTAQAAEIVFPRLTVPGFGFDVEALFIAHRHHLRIVQAPVHFRYDTEPTTLHFVRDIFQMLRDLLAIRWKGWRRRYD